MLICPPPPVDGRGQTFVAWVIIRAGCLTTVWLSNLVGEFKSEPKAPCKYIVYKILHLIH